MPLTRSKTIPEIKIIVPDKSNTSSRVCDLCDMCFKSKKDLAEHRRCHPVDKPVPCDKCGKRFVTDKQLEMHLRFVHGPKTFICEEGCGKTFVRKSDLLQHSILHNKDKPYLCIKCGKRFKAKRFFKLHYAVHKSKATFVPASEVNETQRNETTSDSESDDEDSVPKMIRVFTCDICNKHFKKRFNLKRHYSSHDERVFPCVACEPEVQFKDISSREKHYADCHQGKPFECNICQQTFSLKGNRDRHVDTHSNTTDLICVACEPEVQFKDKASHNGHVVNFHSGVPFRCIICSKPYKTKRNMDLHVVKHLYKNK